jgi:NAD(P)-dependent dehydrogenase (short-subunit alcohol dehydrogenase family)
VSRLAAKVAIVTGGASGIGRASAERFAAEGAAVVVADVAPAGEAVADGIRRRGGDAVFVRTDVAREADIEAMIAAAVDRFGRLDILFNNAGVGTFVPFEKLEPETWDRILAINLRAVYLACRRALPHLRATRGVILNTASQSGLQGQPLNEAYCASKAGVILFTRSLAREVGPAGVRVNCLCPGGIETPLLMGFVEAAGKTAADVQRPPIGRLGVPEDVAAAALFLVSDESAFITGVALPIDGGAVA